jgi:hypothetical protein
MPIVNVGIDSDRVNFLNGTELVIRIQSIRLEEECVDFGCEPSTQEYSQNSRPALDHLYLTKPTQPVADKSEERVCAICLERLDLPTTKSQCDDDLITACDTSTLPSIDVTSENFITTVCNHTFHANCLLVSVIHNVEMAKDPICPLCRTPMKELEHHNRARFAYWEQVHRQFVPSPHLLELEQQREEELSRMRLEVLIRRSAQDIQHASAGCLENNRMILMFFAAFAIALLISLVVAHFVSPWGGV